MSEKIIELAQKVLNKLNIVERHSLYQLKHFILDQEPTNQSRMWQCVREIKARKEALEQLNDELEDFDDKLYLQALNIEKIKNKVLDESNIDKEINRIEVKRAQRACDSFSKTRSKIIDKIRNTTEELEFFVTSFNNLEKIEAIKPFDDFNSQKEYWSSKFSSELHLKNVFGLHIDYELIKSILSLDNSSEIKKNLIQTIQNFSEKMKLEQDKTLDRSNGE